MAEASELALADRQSEQLAAGSRRCDRERTHS